MIGGFVYMNQHKPLLHLALYFAIFNTLLFGTLRLSTPYILSRLGADQTAALGGIVAVMNVGGLLGGIFLGVWGGTRLRIHTIMPGLAVIGAFLALFGMAHSPFVMAFALFGIMFPIPIVNALVMAIIQAKVAPDVQGRVFAALTQIGQILLPIAYLLMGPLADNIFEPAVGTAGWGSIAPLVGTSGGAGMGLMMLIGGVLIVVSALLVYTLPRIRRLENIIPDYAAEKQPA